MILSQNQLIVAVNKRNIIILTAIVILAGVAVVYWFGFARASENETKLDPKKVDAFAKCLTQKGVVMYGAYWCLHCQSQKKLFGDSFKYVTYVECTKEIKKCQEKKITGYPTWIFKNGERIRGGATFEDLAKRTNCKNPSSAQPQASDSKAKVESVQQIKSRIEKGEKVVLLDVRTPEEYKSGYIAKSISLPLDVIGQKVESAVKDKNAQIIAYCNTGVRSKKAVEVLQSLGYKNIVDMEGGMAAWKKADYAVVKQIDKLV